ncbi:MAG: hypothetical protein GYB31_04270 [Bacteroidetes bacterium]|nr:hypothetical protein [Bacteroidota bacterium]
MELLLVALGNQAQTGTELLPLLWQKLSIGLVIWGVMLFLAKRPGTNLKQKENS